MQNTTGNLSTFMSW